MSTILMIFQLLPAIMNAITEIEKQFPVSGQGTAKANLIMETVKDFLGDVGKFGGPLLTFISKFVAMKNKTGMFPQGGGTPVDTNSGAAPAPTV